MHVNWCTCNARTCTSNWNAEAGISGLNCNYMCMYITDDNFVTVFGQLSVHSLWPARYIHKHKYMCKYAPVRNDDQWLIYVFSPRVFTTIDILP